MPNPSRKNLAGYSAIACAGALAAAFLFRTRLPGTSDPERLATSGAAIRRDSGKSAGQSSRSPDAGEIHEPDDLNPNDAVSPSSAGVGTSVPDGLESFDSARVTILPRVKDAAEKERVIAQLGDTSNTKRVEALRRLGAYVDEHPTDIDALRFIQSLASRDPADQIRAAALDILIDRSDSRSFELVVECCFNDHAESVRFTAVTCLGSVGDPHYWMRLGGSSKQDVLPLVRERADAAREALERAKLNADARLSAEIDAALEALGE